MRYFLQWKSACIALLLFASAAPVDAGGLNTSIPALDQSRQLIVVTAPDWNSASVTVHCFERPGAAGPWKEAIPSCDAVTGRHGMAWGIGLHGTHPAEGPVKREGDGRAPAGVFQLRGIFGFATAAAAHITQFPYIQLTMSSEGVNDIHSRYYNRVVDSSRIADKDWKSSETMVTPRGLYRWGIIVEHNWKCVPGDGSCIFLHIWISPRHGTSGCTAMSMPRLVAIIRWLDASKDPLLVQLPADEHELLKSAWHLP